MSIELDLMKILDSWGQPEGLMPLTAVLRDMAVARDRPLSF